MQKAPAQIGRYEILRLLGSGGMGSVYLAKDPLLKRQLVVKVVHEGGAGVAHAMERFQREAEISAKLNHPNIITIHDVGEDPLAGPFIAMEYVEGSTLAGLIQQRSLDPEGGLKILLQAARGLRAAALDGIVHRDVKPENILVGKDGRVKLTDFGIARAGESQLTTVGEVFGTPSYIAPELLVDAKPSHATDTYAFAVTAFELLTGKPPFPGDSVASVLYRIANEPPTIPESFPAGPKAVFLKALAKRPSQRFPDVQRFVIALLKSWSLSEESRSRLATLLTEDELVLTSVLEPVQLPVQEPRPATPPQAAVLTSTAKPLRRRRKSAKQRNRALLAGLGAGLAAILAGIGMLIAPGPKVAEAPSSAETPASGTAQTGSAPAAPPAPAKEARAETTPIPAAPGPSGAAPAGTGAAQESAGTPKAGAGAPSTTAAQAPEPSGQVSMPTARTVASGLDLLPGKVPAPAARPEAAEPRILQMDCFPARIVPGESVTVTARIEAGSDYQATIQSKGFPGTVHLPHDKASVETPPFRNPGRTVDYEVVLTVTNRAGQKSASRKVRVMTSGKSIMDPVRVITDTITKPIR